MPNEISATLQSDDEFTKMVNAIERVLAEYKIPPHETATVMVGVTGVIRSRQNGGSRTEIMLEILETMRGMAEHI